MRYWFLLLCALILMSGCQPEQKFPFTTVEKDLAQRLEAMKHLKATEPELRQRVEELEKRAADLPEAGVTPEPVEHYEARFGIGYAYELSDYTTQEAGRLRHLQQQIDQLAPDLEPVFELEARVRELERRLKSSPDASGSPST